MWSNKNSISCIMWLRILFPVPCGWKYYFLFTSLFKSGASTVQSWLVFWHVNIWLLPQLLKEVKPLAMPKILGRAMCSGSTFSWNPPHLALMVYGMNSDLGVDLSDLGVDLPKRLVLPSFISDGGNMPVIQRIPRERLKSPTPGLDSCLKSLSTHHEPRIV